jgi:hypothetical protein
VTNRSSSLTVNVSAGGYCTGLMRVLAPGELVTGLIHVDGRDVRFSGQVAWARAGDPRIGLMGTMGVRFVEIEADLAEPEGQPRPPAPRVTKTP